MFLKFIIISPSNLLDEQDNEYSFDEMGGTIGRKPSNDFVLLDPERYISGKHATIEFKSGQFYITDTSTNGIFINDSKTAIGRGKSAEILNGDKITIGTYQLLAHVASQLEEKPADMDIAPQTPTNARADLINAMPEAEMPDDLADLVADAGPVEVEPPPLIDDGVDPLALLSESGETNSEMVDSSLGVHSIEDIFGETEPLAENSNAVFEAEDILGDIDNLGLGDSIENQPPPVNIDEQFTPPGNLIPENWDELDLENNQQHVRQEREVASQRPAQAAPPVQEQQHVAAQTTEQSNDAINAFLQGCGIDPQHISYADQIQLMHKIGQITQITVNGLMQALRARASLKSGFRVNKTTIAPVENNPLKFSVSAEEAMNIILSDDRKGYMPAVQAFTEGFEDLQTHQMAMMAGMQATISAIIEQFKPEELQEMFDDQLGTSFIPGQKKSRNWEQYVDFYNRLTERLQDDFQNIYGEQFAKAYEEQVAKLDH